MTNQAIPVKYCNAQLSSQGMEARKIFNQTYQHNMDLACIHKKSSGTTHYTYLIYDGSLYKIGKTKYVRSRISDIQSICRTAKLVAYGLGITESRLHELFNHRRVHNEWFDLNDKEVQECINFIHNGEINIEKLQSLYLECQNAICNTYLPSFRAERRMFCCPRCNYVNAGRSDGPNKCIMCQKPTVNRSFCCMSCKLTYFHSKKF